jgi:predicted short-subunit dehydrogenase-like oxidoreductase (DUF2520 family)
MGNEVKTISRAQKSLYHCAAVTVSNHVLSLLDCGIEMLCRCGFDRGAALSVLSPLILGNVKSALERDIPSSLTGPVERCDTVTIASHLHSLSFSQEQQTLYRLLALHLVDIASENHPQRDYSELRTMLGGLF